VAVLAVLPHVGEHRLNVALRALHLLVHAAKGIPGFVVIEFWNRTDGFPGCGGVAVFAGNRKGSVRTTSGLPLGWGCGRSSRLPGKEQEPGQNLNKGMRNCSLIRKLHAILPFRLGAPS
jgi:hypothetical protein